MKAFVADRYEKNGRLRAADMPEPQLRDRDVMVAVHAAGVNLLDPKIHDGDFKLVLKYSFPLILGNDVAGVVTQVEKITTWLTAELNLLPRSRIL